MSDANGQGFGTGALPFQVGERILAEQLLTWTYAGLTGKPGIDKQAVRRFTKGQWTLEVLAQPNPRSATRVISIRTLEEDASHWATARRQRPPRG